MNGDIFLHAPAWVDTLGAVIIGTILVGFEILAFMIWVRVLVFFGVILLKGIKNDVRQLWI